MNMLKSRKTHIISLVLACILIAVCFAVPASAATGNQGYAIHRDGAFFGTTWHAGLMDEPKSTNYLPVLHIGGLNQGVTWCSWSDFINGNTFKGVYRPNSGITSSGRDNIVSMGRRLRTEDLGYTPLSQIDHFVTNSNSWVYPEDLWLIRCDGVVEYCYEWYGYRIYGNNTYWDITRGGFWTLDHHSGTMVTPKSQAQSYMTLVQSSTP